MNKIYANKLEIIFIITSVVISIFCTLPIIIFEAERASSKLENQLKTWQKASTGQKRLNDFTTLVLLSIENKLSSKIDFDDIIHDYAEKNKKRQI